MSISKLVGKSSNKEYVNEINTELLNVEPAEVFDIILDEKHIEYENEYSIGTIKFKRLVTDKQKAANDFFVATPLNPGIKQYPLKHEIVLIISANNSSSGIVDFSTSYYYTDVVNVWGRLNHNPSPHSTVPHDVFNKDKSVNPSKFVGNMTSGEDDIELGEYFPEKLKIPSLKPFEGDTIFEGRFGSSIRFSATYLKTRNNWSSQGNDGDPIAIIRVDKKDSNDLYVQENVNNDASSIYICDGQLIPLESAYSTLKSFPTNPTPPTNYKEKQIIINSGRLFFNAKEENIFLSAKKSISIAATETVNIDFGDKFISGNQSSAQKITRGEDLINLLNSLVFPSPMGPIPFNSATQWIAKQNGNATLSSKNYME